MTRLVRPADDAYPAALHELADPPECFWVRGELGEPARSVAVVGTRTPTAWGVETAATLALLAVERRISVVSGLSPGIVIAAHRAVLEAGGHTLAVLGSGIDVPTPREHRTIADAIVAAGGCLLSEQPPGTRRSPRRLAARNRLQTALSAATIVVQTGTASGAMATARHAHAQGRVLAVVCPPTVERDHTDSAGNLALLSEPGVRAVRDLSDAVRLLDEF